MYILVLIVHIIVSLVLVLVILLQAGRGGGLSEAFGGGAVQSILGTKATTFLTRATAICAVLFMITSLTLAIMSGAKTKSLMENVPTQQQTQLPQQTQMPSTGTKTIRQVEVDPKTGKERIVKEEVVPQEQQPASNISPGEKK